MGEKMTSARLLAKPTFVTTFILFAVLSTQIYGHAGPFDCPDSRVRNVTRTATLFELNPRFVAGGSEILYLEFTGDPEQPMPWDYRLMVSDRTGDSVAELTGPGVVDYIIGLEMSVVKLLVVAQAPTEPAEFELSDDIVPWELWQLDLKTRARKLLYLSKSESLRAGYAKLGLAELPNSKQDRLTTVSPNKENRLVVTRESDSGKNAIKFYNARGGAAQRLILTSERYNTYTHTSWLPPVVWLNEHQILTLHFRHRRTEVFPQNEGVFSIVRVDLSDGSTEVVFESDRLKPFARMSLNENHSSLLFQQTGDEQRTELWRLNLRSRNADMIYWTSGAIGEARSSLDGASLVFSRLEADNFDIIRLDLERHRMQRLAGN